MKKRLISLILCVVMMFSVSACGDNTEDEITQYTVSDEIEKPYVVSLTSTDPSVILTGDYEVTEIEILQYYYSIMYGEGLALREVTDRSVELGDVVCVDYVGYLDGEAFTGGSATDAYIDVEYNCGVDISDGSASGYYIDGFSDGLVGAESGFTISYEVTFPDSYGTETLAGQTTTFEFTINAIYNEVSPEELTDEEVVEYLSSNYDVSTVDEFMTLCEEWVIYYYAMNYILYNSVVEIPEEYLNARLDLYYGYLVEYYGGETELTNQCLAAGYTLAEAKETWLAEVEALVTEEVIFAGIAEQANLTLDEEWYEDYMGRYTSAYIEYWGDIYTDIELTPESVETQLLRKTGLGDTVAAKNYFLNQRAVQEYMVGQYNSE